MNEELILNSPFNNATTLKNKNKNRMKQEIFNQSFLQETI
jgi:hypothetical protein